MRVRAKMLGIYGNRRWRKESVFDIDATKFNAYWMEKVDEDEPEVDVQKPAVYGQPDMQPPPGVFQRKVKPTNRANPL